MSSTSIKVWNSSFPCFQAREHHNGISLPQSIPSRARALQSVMPPRCAAPPLPHGFFVHPSDPTHDLLPGSHRPSPSRQELAGPVLILCAPLQHLSSLSLVHSLGPAPSGAHRGRGCTQSYTAASQIPLRPAPPRTAGYPQLAGLPLPHRCAPTRPRLLRV
jgi:hypothetical protein